MVKGSLKGSIKSYLGELGPQIKNNWLTAGLLYVVVTVTMCVLVLFDGILLKFGLSTLASAVTLLLYGANYGSLLIGGVAAFILGLFFLVVLEIFSFYIAVAIQFSIQDVNRGVQTRVSFQDTWRRIKQMNKNQLLRLFCYNSLFIFLWLLPVLILKSLFGGIQIVAYLLQLVAFGVLVWKRLEYSQSLFLYREKQPQFLGQSQRHALTASRRFMKKAKLRLLGQLLLAALPLVVWIAIWGVVMYFGFYIWEPIMIYGGPLLSVLGVCFYLPLFQLILARFYEQNKNAQLLETAFHKTFKPVEQLTGEAYRKNVN